APPVTSRSKAAFLLPCAPVAALVPGEKGGHSLHAVSVAGPSLSVTIRSAQPTGPRWRTNMQDLTRRDVLGAAALAGGWLTLGWSAAPAQAPPRATAAVSDPANPPEGPWSLPALPYDYAALEPHISAQIVKLHHDIHHAGYVKAANEAVSKLESIRRTGG